MAMTISPKILQNFKTEVSSNFNCFNKKRSNTATKAVDCVAHDFTELTDRLTGIERNGTENSRPIYPK